MSCQYLKQLRDEAVLFARKCLAMEHQPRDDYREFLELNLIILGEIPTRGTHFNKPGAFHHARWMAKVIYCIKIYLFRQQFDITEREEKALLEFNLFSALLYMPAWFQCSFPAEAPLNDLQLLQSLEGYKSINKKIGDAASSAMMRHTWYLSECLVGLSFFSQKVPSDILVRYKAENG